MKNLMLSNVEARADMFPKAANFLVRRLAKMKAELDRRILENNLEIFDAIQTGYLDIINGTDMFSSLDVSVTRDQLRAILLDTDRQFQEIQLVEESSTGENAHDGVHPTERGESAAAVTAAVPDAVYV